MSYDLVKNAHKRRLIKRLSESEDFAKTAGWWDDFKSGVRSAANTVGDVGRALWEDAKENPWTTAAGLAGTIFTGGAAAGPIWGYRAMKAKGAYDKYKKLQKVVDKTNTFKSLQQKNQAVAKANKARAKFEKQMNTRTFNRKPFSDPVKFPFKKNPVNNPVAKTVAAPYRASQGVLNVGTHPTFGMRLTTKAPAGANWLQRTAVARYGTPALGALGVGYAGADLASSPIDPKGYIRRNNTFVDKYYQQREATGQSKRVPAPGDAVGAANFGTSKPAQYQTPIKPPKNYSGKLAPAPPVKPVAPPKPRIQPSTYNHNRSY